MKAYIQTNNPLVAKQAPSNLSVQLVDGGALDVLLAARDAVYSGYMLLSHPLAGSLKPNQTPYKTILLQGCDSLHQRSVQLIENSIEAANKFLRMAPLPNWSEAAKRDFQQVDASFFVRFFALYGGFAQVI